jgi:large subunit ribosomal protein L14e
MKDNDNVFPGRIVKILRGRDEGKLAIIIGSIDDKFVWIADGDKRKFDQPKRKNILHLQITSEVSNEVIESIRETGRVTNGKIRFALGRFAEQQQQIDAT